MSRSPQPGDVLGDRYRVIEVVGSGGMGVVYRAQNIVTEKYVALKWLHPRLASGVGGERLLREARAASLLKHPHIVDVYDLIKDTVSDTWVLIMELLQGETLRDYMQRSRRVQLSSFIAQLLPAMDAVVAAHELGIVHRDLKPENIFLERVASANRVVPKVLDFGIAKLKTLDGNTLTVTGTTLGTPFYMSPEQYTGDKDIDARTDVYAFGAMLYEAITGRMPHEATSLPELALKVTTVDAPPVKSLCPGVPTSLARLVDGSLARRREERIPRLEQLHQELELFARENSFRGEMTQDNASVPLMAARAPTAETWAESHLGVRLSEPYHPDVTPAPAAKTHRPSIGSSRASSWVPWLLLVCLLVYMFTRQQAPERSVHAATQPPSALSWTVEPAAVSGKPADDAADVCARDEPLAALAGAPTALVLAPAQPSPEGQPQPEAPRATPVKSKNKPKAPSAPATTDVPATKDSKRSISKLLAF